MNTFVLSYNPLGLKLSATQLLGFIKESKNIFQWYSPFIGTYIIKSHGTIQTLQEVFSPIFDGDQYIISQVFHSHMNGVLPPTIWEWLQAPAMTGAVNALASLHPKS